MKFGEFYEYFSSKPSTTAFMIDKSFSEKCFNFEVILFILLSFDV